MSRAIKAFTMPKWGIEMEEGVIREWFAKEGDAVKEGDVLVVIETDKIANDVELEFSGVLRRRLGKEGEGYRVGALIAVFSDADVPDAEIDAFVDAFRGADAGFAHGEAAIAAAPEAAVSAPAQSGVLISPKALELSRALGVDVGRIAGSGRDGRISLQDVEQAAKAQGLGAGVKEENPYKAIRHSSMRRTIAKRLTEASQTIPHFYLRARTPVDALLDHRARLKAAGGSAPSVNDYLIKACAVALRDVPEANVHYTPDEMRQFRHVDIAVAVAVDGGLVTPVIRSADEKSLSEISTEMSDLAARARAETLTRADYEGGTFSLSNLGMYGVSSFDAIINPPMAAILAVGAPERVAREGGGFSSVMTLSLSCDHRAIDGAVGGRLLQALSAALSRPDHL